MENYYPSSSDLFTEEPLVYGNFGSRLGASLIDGLILLVPNILIRVLLPREIGLLFSIIMYWLYFATQESGNNQATIGKKSMGLKVVSVNGERLSFGQATGRYFGKIISCVILFIGYFMMLWDARSQTLHDKMADALVVKSQS